MIELAALGKNALAASRIGPNTRPYYAKRSELPEAAVSRHPARIAIVMPAQECNNSARSIVYLRRERHGPVVKSQRNKKRDKP
jgi:hypothetical protein